MPPSPQDLKHMEQVLIAYKATLHDIVATHKQRVRNAMEAVDVRKAKELRSRVRGGDNVDV
jgi:hypothetical protein